MLAKYAPQLIQKLDLSFPLLSDPGNKVAERFGVAFELPEDLKEIYRKVGIDLERFNGDASWRLPMPGRILIDADGTIRDADVHPDYTTRPEPDETVALLRKLTGRET